MRKEYLRIDNGCKISEGIEQLYSLCLQAYQAEIYGIFCGDMNSINCLVRVLCGQTVLDSGKVYHKGTAVPELGKRLFQKKVGILNKYSHLVANLSIAENLYIVVEGKRHAFVQKRILEQKLKELLKCFNIDIPVDYSVMRLGNLERCQLELLKAYVEGMECVVLDWRESFLTPVEYDELILLIEKLKERNMTFIWVDYSAERIVKYSDAVMILSHGKTVRMLEYRPFPLEKLYELLRVDWQFETYDRVRHVDEIKKEVLCLRGIKTPSLTNVHLSLKRGEIATIASDDKNIMEELIALLKGNLQQVEGEVFISGKPYHPKKISEAVKQGVCFVENNSLDAELFLNLSVYDNICIVKGSKVNSLWWNFRHQKSVVQLIKDLFGTDVSKKRLNDLTILDKKKILYYRWMLYNPKLLICIHPFSAVDLYMRHEIEQMLRRCTEKGISILMFTDMKGISINTQSSLYIIEKSNIRKVI